MWLAGGPEGQRAVGLDGSKGDVVVFERRVTVGRQSGRAGHTYHVLTSTAAL